jgi:hypothetical protein
MRSSTLLALLLLAACASPTAVIDKRSFQCGPGQDIEIRAVLTHPAAAREAGEPLKYQVEISNNSHNDVTVTYVRIQPRREDLDRLDESVSRYFDQLIPPGKDHLFELPAIEAWVQSPELAQKLGERRVRFAARVSLANGDSYQCDFETQWN